MPFGAPAAVALLFVTTQFATVSVPTARLIPPPFVVVVPFAIVRPEIVTAGNAMPVMRKTRETLLPLTVNIVAPGPLIMIFLRSISSSPLLRVIVAGKLGRLNVTLSPETALAMAARKLPGPLSFVFVTVMVAAEARESASREQATIAIARRYREEEESIRERRRDSRRFKDIVTAWRRLSDSAPAPSRPLSS